LFDTGIQAGDAILFRKTLVAQRRVHAARPSAVCFASPDAALVGFVDGCVVIESERVK
jgi:hypothetical protein